LPTSIANCQLFILFRRPDKRDEGAFFRRIFYKRPRASLTKRHARGVVLSELCWFCFLALPFFNPFIYRLHSIKFLSFCKESFIFGSEPNRL
jgi:hypothetical protein